MTLRSCPKIFLSAYREARYATIEKQLLALTCGLNKKKSFKSRNGISIFKHFHPFSLLCGPFEAPPPSLAPPPQLRVFGALIAALLVTHSREKVKQSRCMCAKLETKTDCQITELFSFRGCTLNSHFRGISRDPAGKRPKGSPMCLITPPVAQICRKIIMGVIVGRVRPSNCFNASKNSFTFHF